MTQVQVKGQNHTRSLTRGIATSVVARGITAGVPAVLIPLTYREFGPETYAVWSTVVATTSMFLWADLGLGNGLLTKLSPVLAKHNHSQARQLISSAYSTLTLAATVLLGLLFVSLLVLPIDLVLGLQDGKQVRATVAICLGLLLANVPIALVQRVQFAAQEVALSNLFQAVGPLFTLIGALVAIGAQAPSLVTIAVIASGPLVSSAVASVSFYKRRPELRPRFVMPWGQGARSVVLIGLAFLFIQFVSSIAMNSDPVVVAHLVSAAELADFTVTMRIFLVMGSFITVAMLPLWPANAHAIARGDLAWVRRHTLWMSVGGGALALGCGCLLAFLGPSLMPLALGDRYIADARLMVGFTLMWTVVGIASPLFMVQNAAGVLAPQLISWPIFLLTSLGLKFFVGHEFGFEWIPALGAVIYAVVILSTAVFGYLMTLQRATVREAPHDAHNARA